jgi:hypothetical protein
MTKYKVGDAVLVEFKVTRVLGDPAEYHVNNKDMNTTYSLTEEKIFGLVPLNEPMKAGTVVLAGGYAWTRDIDDAWLTPAFDRPRRWKKLVEDYGQPKLIWEPDSD